jgi:hypothetical protein
MAMILTYPTWQDQSLSSHHNSPVNLFSQSNIALPKITIADPWDDIVKIKVEVIHDHRPFEITEEHYVVNVERDREYFDRVVHRLLDRLLTMVQSDELERWINLTP